MGDDKPDSAADDRARRPLARVARRQGHPRALGGVVAPRPTTGRPFRGIVTACAAGLGVLLAVLGERALRG